nr:RNA helicase [Pseudomonadota bacterium]
PQVHAAPQDSDMQPRDGAHNSQSPFVQRDATPRNTDGQPDPLRTSVDSMGGRGRRGGGGGGSRSSRTGGGGGFGPRGAANPTRTFGR